MSSVNHIIIIYKRSNIKKGSRSLASKCPQIISGLSAPERDVTGTMHVKRRTTVARQLCPSLQDDLVENGISAQ
jgi:hypothetical protein